jgi:outer membrane receptor for ferrienterochelin and colicin
VCLLLITAQLCTPAAQASDIGELSLEELMQLKVTTASMRSEEIIDAPGIVTVISRNEIDGFAAMNLGEVLNRATGSQLLSANAFTDNIISFRGQNLTPYNNHVLLMLNGRPLRDPTTGGLNNVFLTTFPLDIIERIEIVRGPGSVLYGSLAFSAVINIITRQVDSTGGELGAELGAGTYGTYTGAASGGFTAGDLVALFGVSSLESDGPEYAFTDAMGTPGKDRFDRKTFGSFVNLQLRGLELTAMLTKINLYSLDAAALTWAPDGRRSKHSARFLNLGYSRELGSRLRLRGNLTHNHHIGTVGTEGIVGKELLAEITTEWQPTGRLGVIAGGTYTIEDYGDSLLIDNRLSSQSLYLQLDYQLVDRVKLIGGAQWNKLENLSGDLSPRVGLISHLGEHFGVKLLYAEAFRKAYPHETSFNHPIFRGNLQLEPEVIATAEAQLFYQSDNAQVSLTYFDSRMSNVIGRTWEVEDNPFGGYLIHGNFGRHDYQGVELEGKLSLQNRWLLLGSFSYQKNEDGSGLENAALHPNETVKLGLLYQGETATIGVFNSFFGEPTPVRERNPAVQELNPEPESYNLLSAKLSLSLDKLLDRGWSHDLLISVEGDNLLDEDIRYPEYTTRDVNSLMPLRGGRTFHIRVGYEF